MALGSSPEIMANATPEYFVSRTWDFPPDGPIALGSVITSIKKPHRRLALCAPNDADVLPSSKFSVSVSKDNIKSGGFSVLTTFLSGLLGLGVDVGADWEKRYADSALCPTAAFINLNSDEKAFKFDRMDTTQFVPAEDYIKRCVDNAAVRRFLETSRYRKPVYIITGIKTVSGAEAATTTSRTVDGVIGAQVDGTISSGGVVPVGGGPEIRRGHAQKSAVSWEGSTDFVFAFKVSEVTVRKSGDVKRERDYTKGALFEHGSELNELDAVIASVIDAPAIEPQEGFESVTTESGDTYGIPVLGDG